MKQRHIKQIGIFEQCIIISSILASTLCTAINYHIQYIKSLYTASRCINYDKTAFFFNHSFLKFLLK